AASPRKDKDRQYWAHTLTDLPEPTVIGTAPTASPHGSRRVHDTLPAEGFAALDALAQSTGANWAEAMTAAFAAYIHRTTRVRDVVLGAPTMSRLGSLSLRVPGVLLTNLPLRLADST